MMKGMNYFFEILFYLLNFISISHVYPFSCMREWNGPPFQVSKSRIQGYGVFFDPSSKDHEDIAEDSILFAYGGIIHLRTDHIGKFHFETYFFLKLF